MWSIGQVSGDLALYQIDEASLARDRDGGISILDKGSDRILHLSSGGDLAWVYHGSGGGEGEFEHPMAIWTTDSLIHVLEGIRSRGGRTLSTES